MTKKQQAYGIIDRLSSEQLDAFLGLFGNALFIGEENPDEFDKMLIKDGSTDNDEAMPLDKFVKELGFEPNDLRI